MNIPTNAVHEALRSRLTLAYINTPLHSRDPANDAVVALLSELAEEITNHAPALAFRLVQQGDKQ